MDLNPLDRIQVADACDITEWLHPAYAKLCARQDPLTAEEGVKLGLTRYAALVRIRESELRERLQAQERSWECAEPLKEDPCPDRYRCPKQCCNPQPPLGGAEQKFLDMISAATEFRA